VSDPSLHHPFADLPPAYGHVEKADFAARSLQGFVFLPGVRLDAAIIHIDGQPVARTPLKHRDDLLERYRYMPVPIPGPLAYELQLPPDNLKDQVHRVTVVGCQGTLPIARMRTIIFPPASVPDIPVPPSGLIELTQGDHDGASYKLLGFRYFHQLRDVIGRHRPWTSIRRMLDWGCGSGRVAAFFLAERPGPHVYGGDYNHWAADWCRIHLPQGEFRALPPLPPLPYPDHHFDLVLALGVVGGCGQAEWAVWLPELRRLLTPHGLLLITIQGRFAAAPLYPPGALAILHRDGFFDGSAYDAENPPNPADRRYRGGTYLTPAYVARTWQPHLRILEHLEGEINSDLDLIAAEPF
jgi:SAM-dependent methyltransferase